MPFRRLYSSHVIFFTKATATIAVKALSIGTTVMSVACRAAKTLHRYLLKQGVGVYGIYLNETSKKFCVDKSEPQVRIKIKVPKSPSENS